MDLENKVQIFKALSDANRLRILKMLQIRKLCVCEITEVLGLATSTVSKHLSLLRQAGFILEEKDGKWVNYLINPRPGDAVLASINSVMHVLLEDMDTIRRDRQKVLKVDRLTICR